MASITDQNWVIWNQGKNPLVNFNFMLRVELAFDLPCKSVRAFARELEYEYIQEGGLNDYVHMRRKPITKPFTLEVERYVGVDYLDPLPLGADLVLPVMLFVARNHDQFIPGVVARTYVFTGCTVMKKTYGDLIADQSGLLVETTTIGYREMLCVDIPWSEVGDSIPKDIKSNSAKPTDAKTQDKAAEDYKRLAQQLYEQAKEAKETAESEFRKDDAEKLLTELQDAIARVEKSAGAGGTLQSAVESAQKGLKGSDGKTKHEIAGERQRAAVSARAELDEKTTARNAAVRARSDAQRAAEGRRRRIEQLERELRAASNGANEAQLEQMRAEKSRLEEQLAAAEKEVTSAQTAVETAEKEMNEAREAWQSATEASNAAREADSAAQRALSDAESALKKGTEQLKRLQNSKTNLSLRVDKTAQAQEDCAKQFGQCETENQKVQSETDEQAVYNGYQTVRDLSKDTCYYERQVRETAQYVDSARKLLENTNQMFPQDAQTQPEAAGTAGADSTPQA